MEGLSSTGLLSLVLVQNIYLSDQHNHRHNLFCLGTAYNIALGVLFIYGCQRAQLPVEGSKANPRICVPKWGETKQSSYMVLQCSNHGDRGSFSEMTIEIGSIRSIFEEEVSNRTKFKNRRVLVPV